jgi:hypothetical protein
MDGPGCQKKNLWHHNPLANPDTAGTLVLVQGQFAILLGALTAQSSDSLANL